MDLQGKHALITGGGTGIGLDIARDLAARGAHVTITGRRQEVLDEVAGDNMTGMAMDVRSEEDVVAKIAAAVKAHGPIQICIPNAGIAEGKAVHKTDMEFWRNMMSTNLDGAFLTIRESLKTMRGTDCDLFHGRIARPARRGGLLCVETRDDWADQITGCGLSGAALYVQRDLPWLRGHPDRIAQHRVNLGTCWYFRRKSTRDHGEFKPT